MRIYKRHIFSCYVNTTEIDQNKINLKRKHSLKRVMWCLFYVIHNQDDTCCHQHVNKHFYNNCEIESVLKNVADWLKV